MAPNPVVIPRHRSSSASTENGPRTVGRSFAGVWSLFPILVVASLTPREWWRYWVSSGAALVSLLLCLQLYRSSALPHIYIWSLVTGFNVAFLIASTSWVLLPLFSTFCYLATFWICILTFPVVSSSCRRLLRRACPGVLFFQDKIAFSSVPALQIDTEVNGLFVIRCLTFSLLDCTIEAHGIELGLRLSKDVELALCADLLTVRLLRHIHLTDVYGSLKVEESEMFFTSPENTKDDDMHKASRDDLESSKTADKYAASSKGIKSGAESKTRKNHEEHDATSKQSNWEPTKSQSDAKSEENHRDLLTQIQRSSQIHVARSQIQDTEYKQQPRSERELRQAVCAKLQDVPSISHTPSHAVTVSFLQTIFPRTRRFLHRLPLLLRLLLNPLSNFHPIDIASVSVAGPGEKLKELLESYVLQTMNQEAQDSDMEQFQEEMSQWLDGASFCLEVADLRALSHVPLSSSDEITTYMRSGNVSMYRTPLDSNEVTQVTHIGGTDATCVMPAYLLPHHEHCLPALPTVSMIEQHDGLNASQSESDPATGSDKTEITVSVHASLPTHFDQSLLDFAAVLLKATRLIDLENFFERESGSKGSSNQQHGSMPTGDDTDIRESEASTQPGSSNEATSQAVENRDTSSSLSRRLASRAYHSVKDGVKKGTMINAVADKANDRWVMKTVSRIAAKLEQAQGDVGYTTKVPLDLKPYREAAESTSKIMP